MEFRALNLKHFWLDLEVVRPDIWSGNMIIATSIKMLVFKKIVHRDVHMEPKHKGFFGFNLLRLGEGLVVGIGVAIVLALYNTVTDATEEMNRTRNLLEKQVEINQKLKDQIELRDQKLAQVQDLVVETQALADNLASLAARVRIVETASVPGSENPLLSGDFDWSQFRAPEKMSSSASDPWKDLRKFQLEGLQDAIDEQRRLQ